MKLFPQRIRWHLTRPACRFAALALVLLSPAGLDGAPSAFAQTVDDGAEFLTRGPVHEAFAGVSSFNPGQPILVPQTPPVPVDELPPDERPDGDTVAWIPGYWAWDDTSTEFIWVSGIWRNLPPGRQWIPGYWSESGQDYQWVAGYWADAAAEEVEYLAEPPASLEAGPNIPAPSSASTWIPGTWRWNESRYAWQGGYWNEGQADWIWVPSCYTSTPRGYVYVNGYYDYDVPLRGILFSPVRFSGNGYTRPDYRYRPGIVITLNAGMNHLFLRPRSNHYYFGDYYDRQYQDSGYYPSNHYYSGGHGYDPIYAHQRWKHRDEANWESRYEDDFVFYRDHREERPPHTFSAWARFFERPDQNRRSRHNYAARLDQYVDRKDSTMKFRKVDESDRERFARSGRELREYSDLRRKIAGKADPDSSDRPGKGHDDKSHEKKSSPVKMPKSPVAAGASEKQDKPGRGNGERPGPPSNEKEKDKSDSRPDKDSGPRQNDSPNKSMEDPRREQKPDAGHKPDQKKKSEPRGDSPGKEPKTMPKSDPRREPKAEPKRDPKGQPQRDPKVEPKREPETDPKREPKAEPKRQPKEEPKPEPTAEPKRQPKAEPIREPKPQPAREPKKEASSRQKKEAPKPQPKSEPRQKPELPSKPKPENGSDDKKGKNKETAEDKDKAKKGKI